MRAFFVCVAALATVEARADDITITTLPSEVGVLAEAVAMFAAPAERVAARAADPASFIEVLPAVRSDVIGHEGDAVVVSVAMKHPWPAGLVEWVETVRRRADGATLLVERSARTGGTYHRMDASWFIKPIDAGRCAVTYRVTMHLARRWAPQWVLRRGVIKGMLATVQSLRKLVE